ncbi:MAG TPA: alpha/beta hydrolase-fold protein [Salinimicrobium sp.]|nr:alpha/beta hydrolase-fold protein [Salinimicrobium sp.]
MKTVPSSKLEEDRDIVIQLPAGYETNTEKEYPVIIVLDGNYLFEPVAGNVDYYSYWDEIPESIVVGVNQTSTRQEDCLYDDQRFLPVRTGAAFFEFLGMELMPYIDKNYRTADYSVVAGHDLTANFASYYLLKEDYLFDAYINLSPDFAPEMAGRLYNALSTTEAPVWFYLATSAGDVPFIREACVALNEQLQGIENENFHYTFSKFEEGTHYSMVGNAIPDALISIFEAYRPITTQEYETKIVNNPEVSPYDFLLKKYEVIEEYYHLETPIRTNDFLAIGKALEFNQNWDDLEKLGKLAQEHYPNSMLGTYYIARSLEAMGKPRKAMETYQMGYGKEEIAFLTVDFMLGKAKLIKEDFGY